jgi:hypothetical protein
VPVKFPLPGCRVGLFAVLIAVGVGWASGGCGFGRPVRDSGSARDRTGSIEGSPPSVVYRIPRSAGACEAVRASGIAVDSVTSERAVDSRTGCTVELGIDAERHPRTLRVRFSDETTLCRARTTFDRLKDADWNGVHSPFSGRASTRREVGGIGAAAIGSEYDAGYYAFFPGVVIAGVPYSQSVLVLRRGNVLLELDLLGGDRTGRRGVFMKPAPPDVATRAFGDIADELLSLITPA